MRYCNPAGPCAELAEGAACEELGYGTGICSAVEGRLHCTYQCDDPNVVEGAGCVDASGIGFCSLGGCYVPPQGGGIDGMGVDACGNVYATEYSYGNVWRISPAGQIELLAHVPSSWIPNLKWGRDLGGFSSEVMYVADRDGLGLFGIPVGVPGATEFYAISH